MNQVSEHHLFKRAEKVLNSVQNLDQVQMAKDYILLCMYKVIEENPKSRECEILRAFYFLLFKISNNYE